MRPIKILSHLAIIALLSRSAVADCHISEKEDNCNVTVTCSYSTSSISEPYCSYATYIINKLVITNSNINNLDKSFFRHTNFDSRVHTIHAINNNWININYEAFSYFNQATEADISYNNIKYVGTQPFESLSNLETLNMSHNIIDSLEMNAFSALNIELLDLSYNRLTNLSTHLSSLPYLKTLYLQYNLLHTLDSRCFRDLKSLQELNLEHNALTTLNMSLTNLKDLKRLYIDYNYLTEFPNDINELRELQYINASHNLIKSISPDSFKNASNLYMIDFSFNNISTAFSGMFNYNTKIQFVDFYSNRIRELGNNTFSSDAPISYINFAKNILEGTITFFNLTNITEIDLANQSINSIKEQSFGGMIQLKYLNLTRNKISQVANSSFVNTSITTLDLSYNIISTLHFLPYLTSLVELYLNNNNITALSKFTFLAQNKIKVLDLSMNMIVNFEEFSLPLMQLQFLNITGNRLSGVIAKNVFSPAKFLRFLDISNFNISKIEAMAFGNISNLARLNISHNQIDFIGPNNFVGLYNMYSLDVSYNCLKQLVFSSHKLSNLKAVYLNNNQFTKVPLFYAPKLLYLDLSNNNITSLTGIGANNFPNITVLRLSHNHIINFNNPETNTLTSLVDLQLSSNNLTDITLSYFKALVTLDLSNNSLSHVNSTFLGNLNFVQAIDMSQNNISDVPPGTFNNMTNLKLLNLSSNYLTQLHYGSLRGLNKTELLDLSRNKIRILEFDMFHECVKLDTLILDYNILTTLDVATLTNKYLPNIKILSIGGNPISCKEVLHNANYAWANSSFKVTALDMVYHEDNVHGIKCGNITFGEIEKATSGDGSLTANYFTTILWCTIVVMSVVVLVIFIKFYIKFHRYKRLLITNQPSVACSLEMEGTEM